MPQDTKKRDGADNGGTPLGQGATIFGSDAEALRRALDEACAYRGDVTIRLHDGRSIEGYLFDCRSGQTLETSFARVMPSAATTSSPSTDPHARVEVRYADIAELHFSGRDTAAGKTWENWVRRYAEKKLKGERADIASDALD